ncbi:DUF1330 domain-containing protein [Salinicola endophyticus]|uniref:DUF1330 domain-containing protein n=1 Tax=Salinicola endophyticus TaxID=1949083 RepID=A0ABY8FFH6_9GAMM|nr:MULTISPECIES: DUF1330 domain-containing protein [Salinicola]WFF41568.1 DUF1330 domain-containing protein [Salinicola endophyticus]
MPKAYWIATVKITQRERYQMYQQLAPPAFEAYGGRLLVRSDQPQVLESRDGQTPERCVIFEFPSLEQALACYHSAEYREARAARRHAAMVDITIVPA